MKIIHTDKLYQIALIALALLPLFIVSCTDPYCFNLCMDGVFREDFGGVVRNKETKKDIGGAIVYLSESTNQRCDACTNIPELTLITDVEGKFRLPDGIVLEQTYLIDIIVEAEGCETYYETTSASSLGTSDDWENNSPIMILKYIELTCN